MFRNANAGTVIRLFLIAALVAGCSKPADMGQLMMIDSAGVPDYSLGVVLTTVDATAVTSLSALPAGMVMVTCNANGHWSYGAAPVATTNDSMVQIQSPWYFYLATSQKVSIIRDTTTNVICSFTPMLAQ